MVTISPSVKYWVIAILTAILAGLTDVFNQPTITEEVIIGGVILVITMILKDIQDQQTLRKLGLKA